MKLIKWLLGLLIGLVVLVSVAAVGLSLFVDEAMVRDKISTTFEAKTGQTLELNGPLKWSVFPWVGIQLSDVVIGNAPGFGSKPLATAKELDVKIAIKPLFQKKIAMDTVIVKGVALNLTKDKNGKSNWDNLAAAGKNTDNKTRNPDRKPSSEPGGFDPNEFDFELKGIELEDVSLHFVDQQQGRSVKLDQLLLKVGELLPGKSVPLRVGFKLENTQPVMKMDFSMSTDMTFSRDFQRLELGALALDIDAAGEGLPEQGIKFALAANVGLDQEQGILALSDFSMSGLNMDVTGDLSVSDMNDTPRVEAKLALQNTNLRNLLDIAGITVVTADPEVLTRVSGNVFITRQGDSLVVKPLAVKLDDSKLDGSIEIVSFKGPVVKADFTLDAIDLDRYLPPKTATQTETGTSESAKQTVKTAEQPDFTALRKLRLDASFVVGKLRLNGVNMEQIKLKLKSRNGLLSMDPVSANLYQGRFEGKIKLDVRNDIPRFSARKKLTGIQIEPLLKDMSGKARLRGTGDIIVNVSSQGLLEADIKRHLNGSFSLLFKDGAYIGFNLAQTIRKATGKSVSNEPQTTDFAELKATGTIRSGVMDNKDLYLASPVLRVTGKGEVDLVKEDINYLLTTKIVGSLEGQGGSDNLEGVAIPVRIKGKLDNPSPAVDLAAAVKANAGKKLEEKKQELLDKAGDKLKDQLGSGALEGLFGR
jgi:AsmA protein